MKTMVLIRPIRSDSLAATQREMAARRLDPKKIKAMDSSSTPK